MFTSYGVLTWLPDLSQWAKIIYNHLRQGGVFYIVEFHPLMGAWELSGSGQIKPVYSYFHEELFLEGGEPSYAGSQLIQSPTYEWPHSLGDIVTALIEAGLKLEFLHEFPFCHYQAYPMMIQGGDGWWRFPEHNESFPQMFSIKASK